MNFSLKKISPYIDISIIAALAALASGIFMATGGGHLPDGTAILPLDDSYIHLQYAWQTAHGHFLQYNTGDLPTTGATSLSYMLLIALGYGLGISKQAMPNVVLWAGVVLFSISTALITDLACRVAQKVLSGAKVVTPQVFGLMAGLLFAGSGWMAWSYASGMETGLLILFVIGSLWAVLERRAGLAALFVSLAVVTRPEALILGVVILGGEIVLSDSSEQSTRLKRIGWACVPLVVAVLPFILNYLLTGAIGSSGLQAKSLFTLVPAYPGLIASEISRRLAEIVLGLFGWSSQDGHWLVFPLTQVWMIVGFIVLLRQNDNAVKRLALVAGGWIVLGIAATATLQTAVWHHYRYQMPLYPAVLILLAAALVWLLEQIAARVFALNPIILRSALGVMIVAWGVYTLVDVRGLFWQDTTSTGQFQIALANWMHANLPEDALVAVHDVGTLAYYGERRTLDVIGLTSPGMATNYRNGPGAIYESLRKAKPDYYAIYPDTAPPYFSDLNAGLMGTELFRVSPEVFSPYNSATNVQIVTQPDWSLIGQAEMPHQSDVVARLEGWSLVDTLDLADLDSEHAHNYEWYNKGMPAGFPSDARLMSYRLNPEITLADGGRLMTGGEDFDIKTTPGQPLMLVVRAHQNTDVSLRVSAGGKDTGLWQLPSVPGQWLESTFVIPAEMIIGDQTHITITVEEMFNAGVDSRYSPFHYWAYQGGTLPINDPEPATASTASFGEAIRLIGWDMGDDNPQVGSLLDVTLHWQAVTPPHASLRVFLHLVDPSRADVAEGIMAQADSAPRNGTYPFWVWADQEIVSETMLLQLPPDLQPGEYLLLVGIYDEATGQRLPIVNEADFGSNRLLLMRVTATNR